MSHNEPTKEELQRMKNRFTPREVSLHGQMTNTRSYYVYKRVGSYAFANSASNITNN